LIFSSGYFRRSKINSFFIENSFFPNLGGRNFFVFWGENELGKNGVFVVWGGGERGGNFSIFVANDFIEM